MCLASYQQLAGQPLRPEAKQHQMLVDVFWLFDSIADLTVADADNYELPAPEESEDEQESL